MRQLAIVIATVVAIAAVAVVLNAVPPSIEADAASTPVVRTTLVGPVEPSVDPNELPTPGDGGCLGRIRRGTGWLDLCWQAGRYAAEEDPAKDYYLLQFGGSFGDGLRWVVIRGRLVDAPAGNVFSGWPDGTYLGACRQEQVHLVVMPGVLPPGDVCGRTDAASDLGTWTHTVTWRCESCLFGDSTTRAISLYNFVAVPAGARPSWDLFADAGG